MEPIDVVYTWVNGSDPKFLASLKSAKEDRLRHLRSGTLLQSCPFENCFPSHFLSLSPHFGNTMKKEDLIRSLPHIDGLNFNICNSYNECGEAFQKQIILGFNDSHGASNVTKLSKKITIGLKRGHIGLSYWTTDPHALYAENAKSFCMIKNLSSNITKGYLKKVLTAVSKNLLE